MILPSFATFLPTYISKLSSTPLSPQSALPFENLSNHPYGCSSLSSSASSSTSSVFSLASSVSSAASSVDPSSAYFKTLSPDSDCPTLLASLEVSNQNACGSTFLDSKLSKHVSYLQEQASSSKSLPKEELKNPRRTTRLLSGDNLIPVQGCTKSNLISNSLPALPPPLLRHSDRKGNFVESLVDTSAQIVETIWPVAAPRQGVDTSFNKVLPLRTFIQETLRRSRTSYSTLQVALYYIVLLKPHVINCAITLPGSELPRSDKALQCGRRMFLASLILASKYLQDRNYSARAWSKISGLDTTEINMNEILFLTLIDWKLHISETVFEKWTNIVLKYTPSSLYTSMTEEERVVRKKEWSCLILSLDNNIDCVDFIKAETNRNSGLDLSCSEKEKQPAKGLSSASLELQQEAENSSLQSGLRADSVKYNLGPICLEPLRNMNGLATSCLAPAVSSWLEVKNQSGEGYSPIPYWPKESKSYCKRRRPQRFTGPMPQAQDTVSPRNSKVSINNPTQRFVCSTESSSEDRTNRLLIRSGSKAHTSGVQSCSGDFIHDRSGRRLGCTPPSIIDSPTNSIAVSETSDENEESNVGLLMSNTFSLLKSSFPHDGDDRNSSINVAPYRGRKRCHGDFLTRTQSDLNQLDYSESAGPTCSSQVTPAMRMCSISTPRTAASTSLNLSHALELARKRPCCVYRSGSFLKSHEELHI